MSHVLRIADYGRHSVDGDGHAGKGSGGVTEGTEDSGILRRGEALVTVMVTALAVVLRRNGLEQRFSLGPFSRGHEAHRRLRPGDTLVVVTETRANGHTEVSMPECGCRAMIWQD